MVGGLNFVSAFGGLAAGAAADRFGRRPTLLGSAALSVLGSVVMAVAPAAEALPEGAIQPGYAVVCAGRVVCGLGIGGGLLCGPLYSAELAPKAVRGALVSVTEISINAGIVFGFAAGYWMKGLADDLGWRLMLGLGGAVPLLVVACAARLMGELMRDAGGGARARRQGARRPKRTGYSPVDVQLRPRMANL